MPFPTAGDPEIGPGSLVPPALAGRFFTTSAQIKKIYIKLKKKKKLIAQKQIGENIAYSGIYGKGNLENSASRKSTVSLYNSLTPQKANMISG